VAVRLSFEWDHVPLLTQSASVPLVIEPESLVLPNGTQITVHIRWDQAKRVAPGEYSGYLVLASDKSRAVRWVRLSVEALLGRILMPAAKAWIVRAVRRWPFDSKPEDVAFGATNYIPIYGLDDALIATRSDSLTTILQRADGAPVVASWNGQISHLGPGIT